MMSKARQNKDKEKKEKTEREIGEKDEKTSKPKPNSISNYFLPKSNSAKELISSPKKIKPSEKTVHILASFSAAKQKEQIAENFSGQENQVICVTCFGTLFSSKADGLRSRGRGFKLQTPAPEN